MLSLLREGCESNTISSWFFWDAPFWNPVTLLGRSPCIQQEPVVKKNEGVGPQPPAELPAGIWSNLLDRRELYFHMPQINPLLHRWWECKWVQPRWKTA